MTLQMRPRGRRPQAIRRRTVSRAVRFRILDGTVLLVLAAGLFLLARPVGATERPVQATSGDEQAAAYRDSTLEPTLPSAGNELVRPAPASETIAAGPDVTRAALSAKPRQPTLYELAAARYGLNAKLLRALHLVESSGASDGCLANLEGSGALGPLQFQPTTFRAYGIDADGNGRADICGFADSLFSAARYLRALGADANLSSAATWRALARYGTDPGLVLLLAR